jgi:hypothetical protein
MSDEFTNFSVTSEPSVAEFLFAIRVIREIGCFLLCVIMNDPLTYITPASPFLST